MRPIRYIGRHRNAGYGYSLVQRCRREIAYWLRDHNFPRLGYLVDFNRDRYLEEYADELNGDQELELEHEFRELEELRS